ncbi:SRR1 [Candida theae]|uniref:Stress response regulator protein 1 n=1 Tax=Candida theae TaxID=1198502 RepID=A0AAD5BFD7_9ASCO|nr:SRR1 [Candida theae]KAI5958872.1 SRR1 [Candida theae]
MSQENVPASCTSSLPSISLPTTPVKSLTDSWQDTLDYFSIKPQLSLEISQDLCSVKSRTSDRNNQADDESSAEEDYDDAKSQVMDVVTKPLEHMSLQEDCSPITPFEKSVVSPQVKPQPPTNKFNLSMPNLQQHKFLIVDDNIINLKILNRILLKLYPRCSITQIQDSTQVEKIVLGSKFDTIFIDIEMPNISGLDIAQFIRNDSQFDATSLIAVTTRNSPQDLQLFKQYGIDYTFGKPLNYKLDFMTKTIEEIMGRRQRQTESQSRNLSTSSKSICATASTVVTTTPGSTAVLDFIDLTVVHSVSSLSSTDSYTVLETKS